MEHEDPQIPDCELTQNFSPKLKGKSQYIQLTSTFISIFNLLRHYRENTGNTKY
jgi:hypothetical protein